MNKFLNFLFRINTNQLKAKEIKENPEKRPKSFRFGLLSIILSVIAVGLSCVTLLMGTMQDSGIYIFFLILAIGLGIVGPVILLVDSLVYMITQITINKNWATWLSIIIFIASTIGSAIIILHGFSAI